MTNRIDRLSQRGYVTRESDPADRRGVLVRLTASGRRKIDLVASDVSDAEATTWKRLGARNGADLDAAASALLARFDE
jgi:DNA-binding MarR family transcriptional regulator